MIKLKGIHLSFDEHEVLSDIDLHVEQGQTVALIGPSGSGKTTLLKIAVGLIKPDQGQVGLAGQQIARMSRSNLRVLRRKVGMLFQGNALFDSMNVAENVGFVLREVQRLNSEKIKEKVDTILDSLRLGDIGHKMPSELSGGMKKRVGIARVLIGDPQIILYDDPTAGLDPVTSDAIAELIKSMTQRLGATSILVSNQMQVVQKLAHRVVMLRDAKLIDLGPPDKMLESHYFESNLSAQSESPG